MIPSLLVVEVKDAEPEPEPPEADVELFVVVVVVGGAVVEVGVVEVDMVS